MQNLERNFLIQQKLVEAAKKLAGEPDLCKNVKKKRKHNYTEAVKKLQEIENAINEYRIKCGKKSSQKSSLTLPGTKILPTLFMRKKERSFCCSKYGLFCICVLLFLSLGTKIPF